MLTKGVFEKGKAGFRQGKKDTSTGLTHLGTAMPIRQHQRCERTRLLAAGHSCTWL